MRKIFFLIKHASWFTRIVALLALAVAIVSISTVYAGSQTAMDTPVTQLPVVTTFVEGDDLKDIEDEFGTKTLNEIKETIAEEADEEVVAVVDTIFKAISIYATVIIVVLALATVFMKKGLMIFGFILSLPYSFLFVGMNAITTMGAALVVYFILMTIVNKKYKAYKRSK